MDGSEGLNANAWQGSKTAPLCGNRRIEPMPQAVAFQPDYHSLSGVGEGDQKIAKAKIFD
jgi:hypothetical protein